TGTGAACPSDAKKASATACTSDGNPCSLDQCDGAHDDCRHPAGNAGSVCRASAGFCDVDELCTGTSTVCAGDAVKAPTTRCRASAGECDPTELCTGAQAACPSDAKKGAGTACTADANPCSLDQCDGVNDDCQHPAGNAGATCRASVGECDATEVCSGAS